MEKPVFSAMDQIFAFWPYVAVVFNVVLALVTSGHAVLSKRNSRRRLTCLS